MILHKICKCTVNGVCGLQTLCATLAQNQLRLHIEAMFLRFGVTISNDPKKPFDIRLKDDTNRFFIEFGISPFLGLGETFAEGVWETDDLVILLSLILLSEIGEMSGHWYHKKHNSFVQKRIQLNIPKKEANISYFYEKYFETLSQILDPLMLRFGWADGSSVPEANKDLSTAQNQRLKSIGKLLELVPGMRVLVIGCWSGSVSRHLALVYATSVTTITYGLKSTEITYEKCKNLPVEVRNLEEDEKWEKLIQKNETFDRIIGIEPYRFISQKKQKEFFKLTSDWLVPGGFLLIETQGNSNPRLPLDNLFWQKYFISGGSLPNSTQILKYATSFGFELDYLGNTSHNYFLTISNWRENLLKAHYQLIHCGISEIEYRRWNFALALHAAALETERLQSWEFLFRKHEIVQYN